LSIDVDSTTLNNWGIKLFQLFKVGTTNSSELDTDQQSRRIRYDHSFILKGWVFDQPPIQDNTTVPEVLKFDIETYDETTDPPTLVSDKDLPEETP